MVESAIFRVAELVLRSGRDRIPQVPDRRRIAKMRRYGLLQYPDGYSVTSMVMERAALWWRNVARGASKYGNHAEAQDLTWLADKADEWVESHVTTRSMLKRRFGDLSFQTYARLWEVVTHFGVTVLESELYNYEKVLLEQGYLQRTGVGDMLVPTDKALGVVQRYGDPFLANEKA